MSFVKMKAACKSMGKIWIEELKNAQLRKDVSEIMIILKQSDTGEFYLWQ